MDGVSVVVDFDPEPGDQGVRMTQVEGSGAEVEIQRDNAGIIPY